jgi:hypothetical protein
MKLSISQIKTFKACRRAWELRYKEGLRPVQTAEALELGKSYHALLEALEKGEEPDYSVFDKPHAMAAAYQKYILPQFRVVAAEQELEKELGGHTLHGFVDGLSEDGYIVEHKTTSADIAEGGEYEYNLLWDEQVLAYMSLSGLRKVHYTVCKKPTIRLKKDETEEQFFYRMLEWYDDDTENKIRVFTVERTDEEVAQWEQDFVTIADEMERGVIYKNTCHCMQYGRQCEYSSVCLHYDPEQQYIEFTKE